MRNQPFLTPIRSFNKRFLNRLTIRLARSSHGVFAIIRHVGRRSGTTYETPIIVVPTAGGFVIALTYGSGADWYRNVVAAGQCILIWHKREYAVEKIEALGTQMGLLAFPPFFRVILKTLGTHEFVKMTSRAG